MPGAQLVRELPPLFAAKVEVEQLEARGTLNAFRVWGFGGLEVKTWGLGFRVWGLGFGVWGLGFGVWGWGLGFGGWGFRFGF